MRVAVKDRAVKGISHLPFGTKVWCGTGTAGNPTTSTVNGFSVECVRDQASWHPLHKALFVFQAHITVSAITALKMMHRHSRHFVTIGAGRVGWAWASGLTALNSTPPSIKKAAPVPLHSMPLKQR